MTRRRVREQSANSVSLTTMRTVLNTCSVHFRSPHGFTNPLDLALTDPFLSLPTAA